MKMNQSLMMVVVAGSCLTLPLAAQPVNNNDARPPGASSKVSYTDLEKANKLIGMEVTDLQLHKLGNVKDLAVDLKAGRVAEVIVGTGGFIGMDEKMIAVPPQSLSFANSGKELRLADADTFRIAPFFHLTKWEEATSSANVADVYQRFHAPSYGEVGALERADKIMGRTARNQQRQDLGKVDTLVVDLSGGRVVEVIVATGGFLGIKDELSAVPPDAFRYEPDKGALTLDTTRDAMKNAPHFKPGDWRNSVSDQMSLTAVYNAYNVPPYFTSDTTVQNAVPTEKLAPSDSAITSRIQELIQKRDGLSDGARGVQVTTENGSVTLRGTVPSETEKNQLGDLAATVVQSDHVNNQIEVKATGVTSMNN
jgi:sporulation protein YlmC with PRC-barrel domain